jgi:hypothetical protein
MIVALRITVGRDAKGRYVLVNGSAFGVETAPGPVAARAVESVRGAVWGVAAVRDRWPAQARAAQERANAALRIESVSLL